MISPGILHISKKTYGVKNNKQLHKCFLHKGPTILIPYNPPIKFNKEHISNYVLIKDGQLFETIGHVNNIDSYCKYLLYCYNLWTPFCKISEKISPNISNKPPIIPIYSIDPIGCKDIDDAFSIIDNYLYIYIADVPTVIPDIMKLYKNEPPRIETVYLPNTNYPMIPTIYSENYCSLLQNTTKPTITLKINTDTFEYTFSQEINHITKNLHYEETHPIINELITLITSLNKHTKCPIKYDTNIFDSHTSIEFLMILFNHLTGIELHNKQLGIFRHTEKLTKNTNTILNGLTGYYDYCGIYSLSPKRHELLNLDIYVHATSPIRRLVDYINLTLLFKTELDNPIFKYLNQPFIDFLNITKKNIKKTMTKTSLLNLFIQCPNQTYTGQLLDDTTVLLNKKHLLYYKNKENLSINTDYTFKVYVFENEETNKIKLQRVNE